MQMIQRLELPQSIVGDLAPEGKAAYQTTSIPDPYRSALATVEPLCTPQVCQLGGVVDAGEARAAEPALQEEQERRHLEELRALHGEAVAKTMLGLSVTVQEFCPTRCWRGHWARGCRERPPGPPPGLGREVASVSFGQKRPHEAS